MAINTDDRHDHCPPILHSPLDLSKQLTGYLSADDMVRWGILSCSGYLCGGGGVVPIRGRYEFAQFIRSPQSIEHD